MVFPRFCNIIPLVLLLDSCDSREISPLSTPYPPPSLWSFVLAMLCSCFDHKGSVEGEERTIRTSSGSHADIQEPIWTQICHDGKRKTPSPYPSFHSFINKQEHCIYKVTGAHERKGKKGFLIWDVNVARGTR